jgi:hypothetical protein
VRLLTIHIMHVLLVLGSLLSLFSLSVFLGVSVRQCRIQHLGVGADR